MLGPNNLDVLVESLDEGLFVAEASDEHADHLTGLRILGIFPGAGSSSEPGRDAGDPKRLVLKRKPWLVS